MMLPPARTLVSSTGSSDSMTSRDPVSMDKSDSLASVNSVEIAIAETQATRDFLSYCMKSKQSLTKPALPPRVFNIVAILLLPGSLIGRNCFGVGWTLISTNDVNDLCFDRPPASKLQQGHPKA